MSDLNPSEREETEHERLDRELNELRVAMPGVQVLFAFLLAVPFQQRFVEVTDFQRDVYFVTLLAAAAAAAAASALFIAPTAYHRLMFRARDKPMLIAVSSRLAVCGLACLALAMNGAVLLVTDVLFASTTVVVTIAVTATLYIGLWFVLGLVRRVSGNGSS